MAPANNPAASSQSVLAAVALIKRFPGVVALKGVSFDLRPGEIHAICGENGAGKSTLIKTLSGIHPAGSYEGDIHIDGKPARLTGPRDAEVNGIAVIYQELALVPDMTVAENVFLGSEPRRLGGLLVDWDRVHRESKILLDRFGLNIDPMAKVSSLGVGHRQLVEIVKALSKQTRILILDEPTAALTGQEVAVLLDILRDLRRRGISLIYVSHKLDEVFAIADRITVLRDGQSIVTLDAPATSKSEVIRNMVGREITELFPRRAGKIGPVGLSVAGLCVHQRYTDEPVLSDIDFDVRAGEVLGIGGLMGAGRTELLMHLFGAFGRRVAGRVSLEGRAFNPITPTHAIRQGMVLVSEDRKRFGLHLDQSIGFNLSLSSLSGFTVNAAKEARRGSAMFGALHVRAPGLSSTVRTLSGGNQQKIVIGKAMLTEPTIILLDEPTRGIDVGAKIEVYELINRLTDAGQAVILVSSELPELMGMSDRIMMLHEGRIGGIFERADVTPEKLLAAAMGQAAPGA